MKNAKNVSSTYSVAFAERRTVGDEWNLVKWNSNHHQIGYHRLYFLTEGEARLRRYSVSAAEVKAFAQRFPFGKIHMYPPVSSSGKI